MVKRLQEKAELSTAAHLTCATASKPAIEDIANRYWQGGVKKS